MMYNEDFVQMMLICEIMPIEFCRKLVPVGSIAVDKSLAAGIEVCLQNKLPIMKA